MEEDQLHFSENLLDTVQEQEAVGEYEDGKEG